MGEFGDFIKLGVMLVVAYLSGKAIEIFHYRSIKKRELKLRGFPLVSFQKKVLEDRPVKSAELVASEVVIAGDYFKSFIAIFQGLIGGRQTAYESVLDRAKREAILRMRGKAIGSDIIINMKIESIILDNYLSGKANGRPKAAVIAYGTAITYE